MLLVCAGGGVTAESCFEIGSAYDAASVGAPRVATPGVVVESDGGGAGAAADDPAPAGDAAGSATGMPTVSTTTGALANGSFAAPEDFLAASTCACCLTTTGAFWRTAFRVACGDEACAFAPAAWLAANGGSGASGWSLGLLRSGAGSRGTARAGRESTGAAKAGVRNAARIGPAYRATSTTRPRIDQTYLMPRERSATIPHGLFAATDA